jgi:uncharacterized membrane protein YdjX (TVP38/TMEM64 family)
LGRFFSIIVDLLLVNGDDDVVLPCVCSCTLPVLPVVLVSYAVVSTETPKRQFTALTEQYTFLCQFCFFLMNLKVMNNFCGSLSWPTRLHSNNPLEILGIWLYLQGCS